MNDIQSRVEEILYDTINGDEYNGVPESRVEELLLELKEVIEEGGGGGGGTTDYTHLSNKPKIEGVTLTGDKSADDLGLAKDDIFTGASSLVSGKKGLVPAPSAGDNAKALFGDGTWKDPGSSKLTSAMTAAVTVGGVTAGDSFSEGTSLETVIRDILEPTLYPSFTAPSATMSATGTKLLEKGSSLATVFTITFNRGSIAPAYGTNGYRSGEANAYYLNSGTGQAGNTFSVTVTEANKTYQGAVSYDAGEQPKDSKGHDYSTPLAAGSVNTNTITYEFVDAIWANTADITTVAKLSLTSKSTKQRDLNFPAQTVANPEVFDIPSSWTVTAVQVKNDLSGQYEDAMSQFTVTRVTHNDAAGNSVNYDRYTFNLGYGTGARSVRVKWS